MKHTGFFLSGLTGLMHNICFYLYRPLPSPWASIFLFHPTPSITHLHMFLSSTPPPHLPGSICPSLFTYLSITSCFCLTTPSLLLTLVILPHHSQSLCIALTWNVDHSFPPTDVVELLQQIVLYFTLQHLVTPRCRRCDFPGCGA